MKESLPKSFYGIMLKTDKGDFATDVALGVLKALLKALEEQRIESKSKV